MNKLKYALITTMHTTMSWFMIPYAYFLKEKGFDVFLICNMSSSFFEKYSNDFKCISVPMERGIHIKNLMHSIKQYKRIFKEYNFDVIEYGTENASFVASYVGKMTKIKARIYNHWGILYIGFTGLKRFLVKTMEKTIVKQSTDVRQVSNLNLEFCRKHGLYKKNVGEVLGKGGTIGVDITKFDFNKKNLYNIDTRKLLDIPSKSFVFGYTGRIQKDKGIDELIESFMRINNNYPDTYLVLVGGIDKENCINKCNYDWAQQNNHVVFAGYTNEVEKYMSCFDVLVHPSYREGFGMVLQEAGALAIPIITTNIPGPKEFIHNNYNGVLVEPKNIEDLYEKMSILYKDEIKRKQLGMTCYQYVVEYFERNIMISRIFDDRMKIIKHRVIIEENIK